MKMQNYTVSGINPNTKRRKKIDVVAFENSTIDEIGAKSRLLAPYKIEKIQLSPPSDAQIRYAADLGIPLRSDYDYIDISCLISKETGEDSRDIPTDEILQYAYRNNVYLSPYCGTVRALMTINGSLSLKNQITFFIFMVYRHLSNDTSTYVPENSPYIKLFNQFADAYIQDSNFIRLFNECYSENYIGKFTIKQRKVYQIAKKYLINNGLIENRPSHKQPPSKSQINATTPLPSKTISKEFEITPNFRFEEEVPTDDSNRYIKSVNSNNSPSWQRNLIFTTIFFILITFITFLFQSVLSIFLGSIAIIMIIFLLITK